MSKRYMIEIGEGPRWRVVKAPASYRGDYLTREEAANRIIAEIGAVAYEAKRSLIHARRILREERAKREACTNA